MKKYSYYFLLVVFATGCKAIKPRVKTPLASSKANDIIILLDGTKNTPKDNTNIFKLWNLKTDRANLGAYYSVGVGGGSDNKITGLMFGVGFAKDVQEAYRFICQHYDKKNEDRLFVFGFSRGSYTSQVLANLIYTVGVLDLEDIVEKDQKKLIKKLYNAYIGDRTFTERKRKVAKVIQQWEWKYSIEISKVEDVTLEVLGLFDNVEALAAPDYKEKFCAPNRSHLNQYVNIEKVLHAASLDDNRAQIFTPILSTCSNIKLRPDKSLDDVVKEVWFSGAHSDVGGGYADDDCSSEIPLSWMINEVKDYDLFTPVPITEKHIDAKIHDAEDSLEGALYRRRNRDIPLYLSETGVYYNEGKLNLHESVLLRFAKGSMPFFKRSKESPVDWYDTPMFSKCFKENDKKGRDFIEENCDVIKVVKIE